MAWLTASLAGNHAGRSFSSADTLTDVRNGDLLDAAALTAQVVAAVVAIMIVRQATSRQLAWAQRIGARAGDAVPALPPAAA